MSTFIVGINVAVMLLLISILYFMQKKHISFNKRVFTALALGISFGFVLQFFSSQHPK